MGGASFSDAIRYSADFRFNPTSDVVLTSQHNLEGQHRLLTGHAGHVDGTGVANAILNLHGDGELLQTYELGAQSLPAPVSVFVEDIRQLQVAFVLPATHRQGLGGGSGNSAVGLVTYAFVGFLE